MFSNTFNLSSVNLSNVLLRFYSSSRVALGCGLGIGSHHDIPPPPLELEKCCSVRYWSHMVSDQYIEGSLCIVESEVGVAVPLVFIGHAFTFIRSDTVSFLLSIDSNRFNLINLALIGLLHCPHTIE